MKRWPLRWKLALYAAALAVVATLAGAATTWTIMRYWEIHAFDQRLALDAQELFRDVENFEGGLAANSRTFQERFAPLALRDRARADARISGQGLGLSIAGELAKAHGGRLELMRSDREWTEFRLSLPRVCGETAQPEAILA